MSYEAIGTEKCVKIYKVLSVFGIALICIILFMTDLFENVQKVRFRFSNMDDRDEETWRMASSVYNIRYRTLDDITRV